MTKFERMLDHKEFNLENYLARFQSKIDKIKEIGELAAAQYTSTYKEGGVDMRFADLFRKYKRLEKEFSDGVKRVREKAEDDLKDLAVYCIVMWVYLDELNEIKESDGVEQTELKLEGDSNDRKG